MTTLDAALAGLPQHDRDEISRLLRIASRNYRGAWRPFADAVDRFRRAKGLPPDETKTGDFSCFDDDPDVDLDRAVRFAAKAILAGTAPWTPDRASAGRAVRGQIEQPASAEAIVIPDGDRLLTHGQAAKEIGYPNPENPTADALRHAINNCKPGDLFHALKLEKAKRPGAKKQFPQTLVNVIAARWRTAPEAERLGIEQRHEQERAAKRAVEGIAPERVSKKAMLLLSRSGASARD